MDTDPRICYQAVLSRDPRFDGRFFTAVVTTGVYCRPICPARTPKRQNIRFFACAAAAEQEGFRPCKRCRPETSPGTPAWLGTSATVSRALRLISAGALDGGNVDDLAGRLGIGSRHLRRLFDEHLGASPVSIAQTRRVHFARRLIDETDLPMTELAHCAGYSSVRRFNASVRGSFGKPPSELRVLSRRRDAPPADAGLILRLPYRPPYDWTSAVRFLRARAIPGVEAVSDRVYKRSITVGGSAGILEVRPIRGAPHLLLRLQIPPSSELPRIVERVRSIFDLGADPMTIATHLHRDPRIARAIQAHPGLRVPGCWDGFELAVRAILGQQITVKGATTLAGRMVREFGRPLESPNAGEIDSLFPEPSVLAKADLSSIGLTRRRAAAIHALAAAVRDREIDLDAPGEADDAVRRLLSIPGVGPWTAHYVAMRAFGDPDSIPSGDLGLRKALAPRSKPITSRQLAAASQSWRPWRSYAAMALWSTLQEDSR
jgi:AraC family transcriptional regulator, regulatory protein of adaptative response / DNA-3-methyladenine glycosylase II